MNRAEDLDPKDSLSHLLAFYVRKYREANGMTLSDLAILLCVSPGHLANLERARRRVTLDQAKRLDKIFKLPMWFELLHHHAQGEHRDWLVQYTAVEQETSELWIWQPLWIPGLLQTPAYARANLEAGYLDDVEEQVAKRVGRQEILGRENPPYLWILIDERALHQGVGGKEVMCEQLRHLIDVADLPFVTLQLVSSQVGSHIGLDGGFIILDSDEGDVAFAEAQLGGRLIQDEDEVRTLSRRYGHIKSLAYPVTETKARLRKILEEYQNGYPEPENHENPEGFS
jgi:transcriptional regulator with XRE-family HTH domain